MFRLILSCSLVLLAQFAQAVNDPTRPASYRGGVAVASEYALQSVLVSGARSIAFINGQALSVGDQVGGARVVTINKESVVLDVQGRTMELTTGRSPVTRKGQWYLTER